MGEKGANGGVEAYERTKGHRAGTLEMVGNWWRVWEWESRCVEHEV
ncbi:hypothetical protein [Bartonella elizabethae]|nr:hypothetical protein [Bartonella elizabethae]